MYIYTCDFNLDAGDSDPVKMFDRTANLVNNQIINYKCDPSEKWLVLIGIAPGSPEVYDYYYNYYMKFVHYDIPFHEGCIFTLCKEKIFCFHFYKKKFS